MKVAANRAATPTTRIIRLAFDRPFPYLAGQAATIALSLDDEPVPYSMTASPEASADDRALEFLVKIDPTARFGAHAAELRRGRAVHVGGPIGSFIFPDETPDRRFLFVAGGTGIAPLRAMIDHVRTTRPDASVRLLYTARSPDEFAYLSDLRNQARTGGVTLSLTVTRATPARWRHGLGRPCAALLAPLVDDEAMLCFLCGPEAMVAELQPILLSLGIAPHRIRVEDW